MLSGKSGVWLGGDALDDVAPASRPVLLAAELLAVSEFASVNRLLPNFFFPERTGFALRNSSAFAWGSLEYVSLH